jgi:hypothetical protein
MRCGQAKPRYAPGHVAARPQACGQPLGRDQILEIQLAGWRVVGELDRRDAEREAPAAAVAAATLRRSGDVLRGAASVDETGRRGEGVAGVVGPDTGLRRPPIADPADEARSQLT